MSSRAAHYFSLTNLQVARSSLVIFIFLIKVSVDRGHRLAKSMRQGFNLVRDDPHSQNRTRTRCIDKLEIMARAFELHDVNGPGKTLDYIVGIMEPMIRLGRRRVGVRRKNSRGE